MKHIDCASEEVLILRKSQRLPALLFFKCCAIVYEIQGPPQICQHFDGRV